MNKEKNCLLPVKIKPKAKISQIIGWENGVLSIKIKSVPEKNKANKELIYFLSKRLKLPQTNISIEKGLSSRKKTIYINGLELTEVKKLLFSNK